MGLDAEYAWPNQEKSAGVLGIVLRLKRIVEAERQLRLLDVNQGGFRYVKVRQ